MQNNELTTCLHIRRKLCASSLPSLEEAHNMQLMCKQVVCLSLVPLVLAHERSKVGLLACISCWSPYRFMLVASPACKAYIIDIHQMMCLTRSALLFMFCCNNTPPAHKQAHEEAARQRVAVGPTALVLCTHAQMRDVLCTCTCGVGTCMQRSAWQRQEPFTVSAMLPAVLPAVLHS